MRQEERVIIENFLLTEEFFQKVSPHLKTEFFETPAARTVADVMLKYSGAFSKRPSKDALLIELGRLKVTEEQHRGAVNLVEQAFQGQHVTGDVPWAFAMTERFCKERAVVNGLLDSVTIMEGQDPKKRGVDDIMEIMGKALGVSFNGAVGHAYFEDFADQYRFYTEEVHRIPFDLEPFNRITKGGLIRKTLTVFMSSKTGGFKSGTMCHMAARWMLAGYHVVYITLEMSDNLIRERIDANLLKVKIDDLRSMKKEWYESRMHELRSRTPGSLTIQEFPTGSAHAGHFRHVLKQLKQKKGIKPDILVVDYLNICAAQGGRSEDASYARVKKVSEEIRALALEFDCAVVSATQSGRQGADAADEIDMNDVSESYGLPVTTDLFIAVIDTEELASKGMLMYKQLKNRYADVNRLKKFTVGVDKSMMTLFEVQQEAPAIPGSSAPAGREARSKAAFDDWK